MGLRHKLLDILDSQSTPRRGKYLVQLSTNTLYGKIVFITCSGVIAYISNHGALCSCHMSALNEYVFLWDPPKDCVRFGHTGNLLK